MIFLVAWLLLSLHTHAAGSDLLDSNFVPPAIDGAIWAVAPDGDGKVVIGGGFNTVGGLARHGIARLNSDGTLDLSFDPGTGISGTNVPVVKAIKVLAGGAILIGGDFAGVNGLQAGGIARLLPSGTPDSAFVTGTGAVVRFTLEPGTPGGVNALAVSPDGKIYVGGRFTHFDGQVRIGLARLDANGSLESSFAPILNAYPGRVAVNALEMAGQNVLVGGMFYSTSGAIIKSLVRYQTTGTVDAGFNANIEEYYPWDQEHQVVASVTALAIDANGNIVLGGSFNRAGSGVPGAGLYRYHIARVTASGAVDSLFDPGSGIDGTVSSVAVQQDSKVIVAGDFTQVNGMTRRGLARLHSSGSVDASFDPGAGPNAEVKALAIQADGRILIGGSFTNVAGQSRSRIARVLDKPASEDTVPVIQQPPRDVVVAEGDRAVFQVVAKGPQLNYQWFFEGNLVAGATNAELALLSSAPGAAGSYQVKVSNEFGVVESTPVRLAILTVGEALDAPQLTWTTYNTAGAGLWKPQKAQSHDGEDALEAPLSPLGGFAPVSVVETMIAGPGRLAFWWKNTGPYSSNFLTLYVNGQVFFCTSADWEERFISLPSGQNIIRWESLRTFSSAVQLLDQVRMIREPRVTVLESAVVSGSFQARFNLEGTRPLGIWMSTNLSAGGWSLLTNYVESVNPLLFTDPTAGQDRQRFYRFSLE